MAGAGGGSGDVDDGGGGLGAGLRGEAARRALASLGGLADAGRGGLRVEPGDDDRVFVEGAQAVVLLGDAAGVEVGVRPDGGRARAEGEGAEPALAEAWAAARRANPRLHDGDMLAVESIDGGLIRCRRAGYAELAVQGEGRVGDGGGGVTGLERGVWQLSVTGMVVGARGWRGQAVLLGRRSRSTRLYGGLWELGPSGGVWSERSRLAAGDLLASLNQEMLEETTIPPSRTVARPIGFSIDPVGRSVDVVFRVGLMPMRLPRAAAGWEYDAVRWVPLRGAAGACRLGVIGPTGVLLGLLARGLI